MNDKLKDIKDYQSKFVYPGLVIALIGILVFVFYQGSVLSVVGIVAFFIGIFLAVHARGEIKKIKYKIRYDFITDQLTQEFDESRFLPEGNDFLDRLSFAKIPLHGDSASTSQVIKGEFGGYNFSFGDLDIKSSKYVRGSEAGGSRTEVKKIFTGIFITADKEEQSDDFIVITPKKDKKKYAYNGDKKYFYKRFKITSSTKDFEEEFVNAVFLESFFRAIEKYGPLRFSSVGSKYTLLIEREQLYSFLDINEKSKNKFLNDINILKDIIKNVID